jgi:hypothetical protein
LSSSVHLRTVHSLPDTLPIRMSPQFTESTSPTLGESRATSRWDSLSDGHEL